MSSSPDVTPGEAPPADGTPAADDALDAKRMSLLEHLQELRVRLRNAGIAFILALFASFFFGKEIFDYLTRPIQHGLEHAGLEPDFYQTGLTTGFWVYFKLSTVTAILVASPFVFWELWKFIAPGLYKKEKRLALTVTCATALCFIAGSLFGYSLLAENTAYYLIGVTHEQEAVKKDKADGHDQAAPPPPVHDGAEPGAKAADAPVKKLKIKLILTMDEVMDFQVMLLLGCGVAFELPVVLSVLGWIGLISAAGLWKFNKYALVLSAIVGGILTPSPDVISQLVLAGPLFLLYNLSIVIVWMIDRARKRKQVALEKA